MNEPEKGSWLFTFLVGGTILGICVAVFLFSYLKLRSL